MSPGAGAPVRPRGASDAHLLFFYENEYENEYEK